MKRIFPLAVIFFLTITILECVLSSSACTTTCPIESDQPIESHFSIGVGAPMVISSVGDKTDVHIRWLVLLAHLLVAFIIATALAYIAERVTKLRRLTRAYVIVAGLVLVITFLISISFSRYYWGYWISRPPILHEINDVSEVIAVIPIKTEDDENGNRIIVPKSEFSLAESLEYGRKDSYYCLDERLLIALDDRELLPDEFSADISDLPALFPLIRSTGILATPEDGYEDSDLLWGVIVIAKTIGDQRVMFIGTTGQQVSNDHRPYYEMLFSARENSNHYDYVRGQRYFYDVAGLEGAEWYVVWLGLALPGIGAGFFIFTIAVAIYREVRQARKSRLSR